jgi:leucyl-tRNA synthetase
LTDWLKVVREDGVKVAVRPTPCHNGRVLAVTLLRYIDPHNDEKLADEELLKAV